MSVTERRHETRTVPPGEERRRGDSGAGRMQTNPETTDAYMRDNPEVMGRSEPRPVETSRSDMWPDMTEYQRRFDALQTDFIEDPKSAVHKAERLIEEAIDSLTRSMRERIHSGDGKSDGREDTEQMRLKMRTYRDFMQSLGGRRAA